MARYHTRYVVSPAPSLTTPTLFELADAVVDRMWIRVSSTAAGNSTESVRPPAVFLDIQLEAASLDEAIDRSLRGAGFVTSLLSFLTSSRLPSPVLTLAFDSSEDRKEHEFLQVADSGIYRYGQASISTARLEALLQVLNETPEGDATRIVRALRWHAEGRAQERPLFKFLSFWFGLESLEPILAKRFSPADSASAKGKTPKKATPVRTPGVRLFMAKGGKKGAGLYEEARTLRTSVVHGLDELGLIEDRVKAVAPELAPIVHGAIAELISHEPVDTPKGVSNWGEGSGRLSVRSVLRRGGLGPFEIEGELPHFDEGSLKQAARQLVRLEQGTSRGVPLLARLPEGFSFGPSTLSLHSRDFDYVKVNVIVRESRGQEDSDS